MSLEYRTFHFELETREEGKEGLPKITGYASVFNSLSQDLGGFKEQIKPGAFRNSLKNSEHDVRALVEHDGNKMLARTKSGTLKVWEDKKGLRVEIDPANTSYARDLVEQIQRGDVDSYSFGFQVIDDSFEKKNGQLIRTVNEVDVFEVSVVSNPAYLATELSLRSLMEEHEQRQGTDIDEELHKRQIEVRKILADIEGI